jgi:hypothetical protein
MTYTASTERMLLWGGLGDQGFFNDTWEWDGEGWVQVADTGPGAFEGAGLSYDSVRNVAVLFTNDPTGTVWETWEWDGEGWTQVEDTGPQTSNWLFGMTYDSARQVTLLEGGAVNGAGGSLPAPVGTWAWDGTAWTQLADVGPSQRIAAGLADDASRQRVVFFGGLSFTATTTTYERDTWEWDGNVWEQVTNMAPLRVTRMRCRELPPERSSSAGYVGRTRRSSTSATRGAGTASIGSSGRTWVRACATCPR